MLPWFVRRPLVYQQEAAELSARYPGFTRCQQSFEKGMLAYRGVFTWFQGRNPVAAHVVLVFPDDFPYEPPMVVPVLDDTPPDEPVIAILAYNYSKMYSVRHQMPGGNLCLFETAGGEGTHQHVSGADALARGEMWLRNAARGRFPQRLDTQEADLDAHYKKVGNIVVGPAVFSDGLLDRGRFVAVTLYDRGEHSLFAVTQVEAQGTWHHDLERLVRADLNLPKELEPHLGDANALWGLAPTLDGVLRGRFYTLAAEPAPIRTPEDLARLLYPADADPFERLSQDFSVERQCEARLIFALRFPGRAAGEWDWLFLTLRLRQKALKTQQFGGFEGVILGQDDDSFSSMREAELGVLRKQDIRPRALMLRNRGRVPQSLDKVRVGLLGAGALGSACADLLVKSGIGGLNIWDPGFFDAGNAIRHLGTLRAIGMPKAMLVAGLTSGRNPDCAIDWHIESALNAKPGDGHVMWQQDALVSTIAIDSTELAFNQRAVAAGATVYYLRALRSGTAARLIRVRPNSDACFECVALYLREGHPDAIQVPPAEGEVITHECGQAILAASAADMAVAAGLGVRYILSDIAAPETTNQWVWTTTGIEGQAGLETPGAVRTSTLPSHPQCPICLRSPVAKIELPPHLEAMMREETLRHGASETGGLLVGKREGDTVKIVAASGPGPQAVHKPTIFERDGAFSQAWLEQTMKDHGGKVEYVGEWHSHPNSVPIPSRRDITSLREIGLDPNYLTDCPVMLIVGKQSRDLVIRGYSHPQDRDGNPVPAEIVVPPQ